MDTCVYSEVANEEKKKISRKYLYRQLFISSGVWSIFFITGLNMGAPTVFVPQLRREINDTAKFGDEMASWLYCVFGLAAVPWVLILPFIIHSFGRKITFIFIAIDVLIAYIIFCTSSTPLQILLSEIAFGPAYGGALVIGVYVLSEYTSPKNRGLCLTIKAASMFWGVWCSNAIGTYLHWKYIGALGVLSCVYILGCFFWTESPYWLAANGRFDECKRAHRWLFSSDAESERNLEKLIKSIDISEVKWTLRRMTATISSKEFIKPLLLSLLLLAQYNLTGKLVYAVYSIDIIKKITGDEATAYNGMLILDGITVFSTYFGCYLSKLLKRRTLYLSTSTIGISFLLIISAYLYLIKLGVVMENNFLLIFLLMSFSLAISCGPMILNMSIMYEITPLRFREFAICITALFFFCLIAAMLKIAPFLFNTLGMHGTFLFYAISSAFCTMLLYVYLPETKDKSLQEIEELFKGGSAEDRNNRNLKGEI